MHHNKNFFWNTLYFNSTTQDCITVIHHIMLWSIICDPPYENTSYPQKRFLGGLRSLWNPFGNLVSEGLKPFGNTLKPFGNPVEMLWNPFEMLWNPLETLLKRFETLLKCFETLCKPFWNALKLFGNPFEMLGNVETFWKPLRNVSHTLWKATFGKKHYSCSLRSPSACWRMRESTTSYTLFLQKCYCAVWLSTDLFIVMERSRYNACEI